MHKAYAGEHFLENVRYNQLKCFLLGNTITFISLEFLPPALYHDISMNKKVNLQLYKESSEHGQFSFDLLQVLV